MNQDPLNVLKGDGLRKDPERRYQAWLEARASFISARPKSAAFGRWRFLAPSLSIAALLVACLSLWMAMRPSRPSETGQSALLADTDLRTIFIQGRSLFGDRLIAVTVSRGGTSLQLAENEPDPTLPRPEVVVMARITGPDGNSVQVAAIPGVPLNVPYEGGNLRIELLPTGDDQLVATGDSWVWCSGDPSSPLSSQAIEALSP